MSRVNESRIYHIRNDKMGVQGEKTSYTLCGFRVPNKQIADRAEHVTCFACLEKSGWESVGK